MFGVCLGGCEGPPDVLVFKENLNLNLSLSLSQQNLERIHHL